MLGTSQIGVYMITNKIKYMLSFLAGSLSLYLFYKPKNIQSAAGDKDKIYCRLFDNWLALNERGDTVEQFFKGKNINEIAVYGCGNIGRHLMAQLSDSNIHIKYVIDKRKDSMTADHMPCYQLSDHMPAVDAIVVTPICEYSEIRNELKKVISTEIISMEDIIYELI